MKKSKFLLLVVLMLALCMLSTSLFTACGGDEEGDTESSVESSTVDSKEEDDKAAEGRDEFIDSLGGVSDTFEGAVSEESYDTAEDAASAYVSNEVAGKSNIEEVEAVSKGELSSSAIKDLKLPEELQEGITSVEKFEVSYSLSEEDALSLASSSKSMYKIYVYVIRYGKEYKYYTPCPINGDTITKSYYDSVFNEEKYENCTFVKTSIVKTQAGFTTLSATITQTIKRDGGKILFEQTVTGDSQLTSQLGGQPYLAAYMEIDENGDSTTHVKLSENASWQKGYLSGVDAESVVPFADQYLDYSYFSKTDFGFALKGDNAQRYYRETIAANAGSQQIEIVKLDLYAEYYVAEGVLSGMRMEYSATAKLSGISSTTSGENTMTCKDYGTTVVEKPF